MFISNIKKGQVTADLLGLSYTTKISKDNLMGKEEVVTERPDLFKMAEMLQ